MDWRAVLLGAALLCVEVASAYASEFVRPWRSKSTSLVVDAYVYTEFDWLKLVSNERLVGFIAKASDGRITSARCQRGSKSKRQLCLAKWRRYVATKQLYRTRRLLAKTLGLKWGSYHLGRPGDPLEQARHYLRYADPQPDELMALDIEDNNPKWMSLDDADRFARYVERRTGRLPVLYTNHSTAKTIARSPARYPTLTRMNLWYARFKEDVRGAFPMGRWRSYAIWQFQAKTNCRRSCAVRLKGTDKWMDVNVVNMPPERLRALWPLDAPLNVLPQATVANDVTSKRAAAESGRTAPKGPPTEGQILAAMAAAGLPRPSRLPVPRAAPGPATAAALASDPLLFVKDDTGRSDAVSVVFKIVRRGR